MAISCKLIRVLYAILTNVAICDPQKMLSDIHRQHKKINCEIQRTSVARRWMEENFKT